MTSIYDIYTIEECDGLCATPANTMGMGNPMLPTAEEPGTEPLHPAVNAPDVKAKAKKKKKHKDVKESVLDDIETNIKKGDNIAQLVSFIDWYIDNQMVEYKRMDPDKARTSYLSAMQLEGKNTIIIDVAKDDLRQIDVVVIKDAIPGNIKTIKFYNCKHGIWIRSFIGDISKVDIEVYTDNGKSFGNIETVFKNTCNDVKFGKLTCANFRINGMGITTLTIDNDSVVLEFEADSLHKLERMYGTLLNSDNVSLPKKVIETYLSQAGIIPWGCKLTVK